jgi:2,4-dienoyl-CoA reductase (NADPH2)
MVPGKRDFGETIRYFQAELQRLGVEIRCNRPITNADADELARYDGIVVATGVLPRELQVPGSDLPQVLSYHQAFADPSVIGEQVAIIGGGGIAVDLSHLLLDQHDPDDLELRRAGFLAEWGVGQPARPPAPERTVTLMRRTGKIGAGMGLTTRWAVVGTVRHHGARMLTGVQYREITADGVMIVDADGQPELIKADSVIIAAGQEPNDALVELVAGLSVPYRVIGGAADTAGLNAVRATSQGIEAAHQLVAELVRPGVA